ncbi:MAG: hypothetical protein Q4F17_05910 [Eubacteriales bacterium]|nr:hypothetical protein [Eubacteriales bacterium]
MKLEKTVIWKWIGLFFGAMVVFTLLSRAVYQHGTAVVTAAAPSRGTVNHTVQITGKTVQNQELAVTTVGGLRVGSVCVNEGQQVSRGDVLAVLDLDYLDEAILTQQQNLKKQQLSVQDAWSQNASAQRQRENQQAQAAENYDSAVAQAETNLDRAQRNLDRAENALEDYYNGVTDGKAEEQALLLARQEAGAACDSAAAALEELERELDQAIADAIFQAEQATPEEPSDGAETDLPSAAELTQEQKQEIEAAVRAEFSDRLAGARENLDQARQTLSDADAALEEFYRQSSGEPLSEQALLDAVEQALDAYDDAVAALDTAKTTYGRAVHSANLPAGTSSSAQIGQITWEQMKLELEKLEALRQAEGKILSPTDGIVTRCNLQTGEKTTDTTAILLADLSQGCKFAGTATEDQSKYIGVGDLVTLRSGSGKSFRDLPVTTFSADESAGSYRLTVQLPAGSMTLGASMELSYTKKSQPYGCCVPLSALRLDERNQTYVLVVREAESVMGRQTQAEKVTVTVLEQNETMAAVAEGALGPQDQVIVSADRSVESGSRVRVE